MKETLNNWGKLGDEVKKIFSEEGKKEFLEKRLNLDGFLQKGNHICMRVEKDDIEDNYIGVAYSYTEVPTRYDQKISIIVGKEHLHSRIKAVFDDYDALYDTRTKITLTSKEMKKNF